MIKTKVADFKFNLTNVTCAFDLIVIIFEMCIFHLHSIENEKLQILSLNLQMLLVNLI